MKIGTNAPSKPAVVVSLLLAILAVVGYFVDSSFCVFDGDVCIHRCSNRRPAGNLRGKQISIVAGLGALGLLGWRRKEAAAG